MTDAEKIAAGWIEAENAKKELAHEIQSAIDRALVDAAERVIDDYRKDFTITAGPVFGEFTRRIRADIQGNLSEVLEGSSYDIDDRNAEVKPRPEPRPEDDGGLYRDMLATIDKQRAEITALKAESRQTEGEVKDVYWCCEGCGLVSDPNHRCEQWSSVIHIPAEAVRALLARKGE